MTPVVQFGTGAIRGVGEILENLRPNGVLLVTGRASYAGCGAEAALRPVLQGWPVRHVRIPRANPELGEVACGLAAYCEAREQVIVAVGGGSVLER